MLKKVIFLSLILALMPLVYAVEINDTLIYSTITNYYLYINSTIYLDKLSLTDAGRIEIYNITSNQTHIPILLNINNTYESVVDLYGLNKALITKNDGSVGCSNIETCSGNKNISIPVNGWIKIYDNYSIETGTTPNNPRPNDPVSEGTSGSGINQSTTLNSSLTSPVIFGLFGLTNALIFNNTYSVLASKNIDENDGEINLTIRGEEVIYILNNYEKSENYTRYLDPIWFSSSSDTVKHIASNLTDSINTTVLFNVNNCDINLGTITYSSNTGLQTFSIDGRDYCSNGIITIPNVLIEPASSSNEFKISYNAQSLDVCTGWFNGAMSYGSFIVILVITLVGGFIIILFIGSDPNSEIDLTMWTLILIVAGAVMSIGMYIISNIGGC